MLLYGKFNSLNEFGYHNLCNLFENLYILAKNNKFDFDASFVFDRFEESSPLVAIVSIFEELQCNEFFALSINMPRVEKKIY